MRPNCHVSNTKPSTSQVLFVILPSELFTVEVPLQSLSYENEISRRYVLLFSSTLKFAIFIELIDGAEGSSPLQSACVVVDIVNVDPLF